MESTEFENLARMIKAGFDDVHEKIDGVDGKVEGIQQVLKKLETRVGLLEEKMDAGFSGVHRRMDDLAEKVGNHEERLLKIEESAV